VLDPFYEFVQLNYIYKVKLSLILYTQFQPKLP